LPTPHVSALDVDESGNIWIASYFDSGQYGITVLSKDKSRLELYDNSNLLVIEDIAIDSTKEKKKWFASHDVGLHVLDDGGTPFDQSDDIWRSYQEPELPSDEVRAVSVDKDGDVWVATTGGTARIREGNVIEYYYSSAGGLPASYIYQMTPDWEGGMWFEHEYGVTRKNPDGTWSNYTTASGLVSDRITYLFSCLSFDTERGALLVGTGGGVSRFLTGLIPRASIDSITVYPNPFIPKEGHLRVTFSHVPDGSVLRIYTMSGELVCETERVVNGFAYWDGRNRAGEEVSSGIYFYAIGEKKRGAIALVR
jgi:streptogramin lyase